MADNAENVITSCNPVVLEVVAKQIDANVTAVVPAGYFHKKVTVEVTPVLVYDGGEIAMEPYWFQGEKVKDNYEVVSNDGQTINKPVHFTYVEGVEQSYLELRATVYYKKKVIEIPVRKVADGANCTYMLVDKTGRIDLKADGYQEIINYTAEGQVMFTINDATVRNSELKGESVKAFQEAVEAIKANERNTITGTDVIAYASPDGGEVLNTKLSDKRSGTAEKAFEKIDNTEAPVTVKSIGQDWEGFKALVEASNIQDKDLIIRVLSMYSDPETREAEIKNMSAVYKELAKDVLPALRRARFVANVEYTNYTNEELVELVKDNSDILDETALLRVATVVKDIDAKVAIYKIAVEKYGSEAAKFNCAAALLKFWKTDEGQTALDAVSEKNDNEFVNACGVVALQKENYEVALDCFLKARSASADENLGVIEILSGKYTEAAAKLANAECDFNKALSLVLVGKLDEASKALTCDCPKAAYLKAVIAARKGDAAGVKTNLEKASKVECLAKRAEKDIEFAQYR
ncbi:MAG: hypothetical protein LUD72_05970 [Bacteroidales bacterium]|nr:hypothetical protein [Bacteroidales bacterium]